MEHTHDVVSIVTFPLVAVATTASLAVGAAPSAQVEVDDQLPPASLIVRVATSYPFAKDAASA